MHDAEPVDFGLHGRVAVIAAADPQPAATWADALAAAGARVVLGVARGGPPVGEVTPGDHRLTVTCDITDHAQVAALMAAADGRFGRIDVLVVDPAGAGGPGPGDPPSHELLRETVRMQLLGLWNCVREAGARMLPRGAGTVIVVTSAPGRGDDPFFPPAHRATAAALEGMTRNLALSWAGRGVRVNALAPGIGDPGALVGPLRFLAGEASRHVNGHTLVVDDGASVGLGHTRADDHAYEFHAVPPPDEVGGHPFWPG